MRDFVERSRKMKNSLGLVLVVVLGLVGANAMAATVAWRQDAGSGYTAVDFDDTFVGTYGQYGAWGTVLTTDSSTGSLSTATSQWSGDYKAAILLGVRDMFSLVPPTSGGQTIVIDSATLGLRGMLSSYLVDIGTIYRMTTPWLVGTAGTNQTNVDSVYSDIATSTTWANGTIISEADWTQTNAVDFNYPQSWGASFTIDITQLMQDIYDSGVNAGFAINVANKTTGHNLRVGTSEQGGDFGSSYEPTIDMEYHYIPEPATMSLLAIGGIGMLIRRKRRA